jgi:hypothetical protein
LSCTKHCDCSGRSTPAKPGRAGSHRSSFRRRSRRGHRRAEAGGRVGAELGDGLDALLIGARIRGQPAPAVPATITIAARAAHSESLGLRDVSGFQVRVGSSTNFL